MAESRVRQLPMDARHVWRQPRLFPEYSNHRWMPDMRGFSNDHFWQREVLVVNRGHPTAGTCRAVAVRYIV